MEFVCSCHVIVGSLLVRQFAKTCMFRLDVLSAFTLEIDTVTLVDEYSGGMDVLEQPCNTVTRQNIVQRVTTGCN